MLFLFVIPLLFACGSKENSRRLAVTEDMEMESLDDWLDEDSEEISETITRKIIKSGTLKLDVKDLREQKQQVDVLLKSVNGYYEQENLRSTNNKDIYTLTIRIPSDRFEQFIGGIESGGNEITHKSIEAKDVTLEYVDLETRLENKRLYMGQYRELLKGARSIEDILEIKERVRRLEEDIESTTKRLRYLSSQVSYSTLHLTLSQNKPFRYIVKQRAAPGEKFKQSFYGGWHQFVDFLYLVLYNWVGIVIALVLFAILFRRYRSWRRKRLGDRE